MSNDDKTKQLEADKKFINMADDFINQANNFCSDETDHRLVHASLLYASARFSAFLTSAMSETREMYDESTDKAIEFYMEEYEKMLKEHFKQYRISFDKRNTPPYPY
jgi:predicted solute-binding protein